MLGELIPCGGGDPIPLERETMLVGRRDTCDIALRFPNISSHHCELQFKGGYWFVQDLGSTNGVKINGERTDEGWLMPGDVLHIAKHLFEVQYEPQGARPPESEDDPFSKGLLEKAGLAQRRPSRPRD